MTEPIHDEADTTRGEDDVAARDDAERGRHRPQDEDVTTDAASVEPPD